MIDIAFIGMGAVSLRSAYVLADHGLGKTHKIHMYEAKSTPARKILMAGIGGLNLTKDVSIYDFLKGYGMYADFMNPYIKDFTPQDLISWVNTLGLDTFVGAGNKVFPKELKATSFVRLLLRYINDNNIKTFYNHQMIDIDQYDNETYKIIFNNGSETIAKTVIIATGGGSYERLGGNHQMIDLLKEKLGISHEKFQPFNVGVKIPWTNHGKHMEGHHLKSIAVHLKDKFIKGDMVITSYGLEGAPIYAVNQDIINNNQIYIDLKADLSQDQILTKILNTSSKNSMTNRLRKGIKLKKEAFFLLKELHKEKLPNDLNELSHLIKNLPLTHDGLNPTNKSISSAGGVNLHEVTTNLEIKSHKNLYIGGEMLNWSAITGGYLLTACFSMGNFIGKKIIKDLS